MGDLIYSLATWLVPLVFAIVFHEISHGWVANMLGDPTARNLGRLTPNPVKHVDPIGTIALPMMLALAKAPVFGWAKPVPVDARRLRNPRVDMMIVAAAGPLMNFFLAALSAVVLGWLMAGQGEIPGGALGFAIDNLSNFLLINLFLGVFNLLPIPPFDGSHIVEGLLPRPLAARYAAFGRYGFLLLIGLIVILPMLSPQLDLVGRLVKPIVFWIANLFLWSAGIGA